MSLRALRRSFLRSGVFFEELWMLNSHVDLPVALLRSSTSGCGRVLPSTGRSTFSEATSSHFVLSQATVCQAARGPLALPGQKSKRSPMIRSRVLIWSGWISWKPMIPVLVCWIRLAAHSDAQPAGRPLGHPATGLGVLAAEDVEAGGDELVGVAALAQREGPAADHAPGRAAVDPVAAAELAALVVAPADGRPTGGRAGADRVPAGVDAVPGAADLLRVRRAGWPARCRAGRSGCCPSRSPRSWS